MSEETEVNEGGMSTVKKTIIGIVTTAVTAAGAYVTTHIEQLFGVEEEEKTEQVEVQNNNTQQQNQSVIINIPEQKVAPTSTNTVIRETVREVPAAQPVQTQPATPVEEPKETNAERMARLKAKRAEQNGGGN
jgi:RES domain-containing protein